MAVLEKYDWLIAIITIFLCISAFSNGANDVANAYATSVSAGTLTMMQVGFLSVITEFVGAIALGSRVTATIKNNIIDLAEFKTDPTQRGAAALILTMTCAEIGSATWLTVATRLGFPVSTTHTVVGSLIGAGIASQARIQWAWKKGSVSQIAASWFIAPCISAAISSILFLTLKFGVLHRRDPLKWALRVIPFYIAFTAGILALFIVVEAPTAASLEEFGARKSIGIVIGVFAGALIIAYVFFQPYFYRRLIKRDTRLRSYHIPLGPLLWKDDPYIPFPATKGTLVKNYYQRSYQADDSSTPVVPEDNNDEKAEPQPARDTSELETGGRASDDVTYEVLYIPPDPNVRWIKSVAHLPPYHPTRIWSYVKWFFLQGVNRDCISHENQHLEKTHACAIVYDNRVEHLWTYAQVATAMLMSIAHGSNDVANAIGPWVAAYRAWQSGLVDKEADAPVFILAVAGLLLGAGFWFFGYHIIRSLGNRITQMSPTRGFSIELGAAITVLMASRLGLPISTTQTLTGAVVGVALMNFDLGAVNWRQVLFIFTGWVLTLPCAGLLSGLLTVMALNTPHF